MLRLRSLIWRWRVGLELARQLCSLVGRGRLRLVVCLFILMTCCTLAEMAGVGSIFPLLASLTHPAQVTESRFGQLLMETTGCTTPAELVPRIALAFIALGLGVYLLSSYIAILQYRLVYAVQTALANRMLSSYLKQEYERFLSQNSAILVRNITSSTAEFAAGVLLYLLFLASNLLSLLAILALLIVVNPAQTLAIGLALTLVYGLLFTATRRPLTRWGAARDAHVAEMNRLTHQAITGIKEVKVLGAEAKYLDEFKELANTYAGLNTRYQVMQVLPANAVHGLVMLAGLGVVSYCLWRGLDFLAMLPTISLYYLGLTRLVPRTNMVFNSWITVRYFWQSFHLIRGEMQAIEAAANATPSSQRVASAEHRAIESTATESSPRCPTMSRSLIFDRVSFQYPQAPDHAFREVSLEIPCGSRVALVGPSGAGKSTGIDLLMGLLRPGDGAILIDGVPLTSANRRSWQCQIGYVPQQIFLADASLAQNIAFGLTSAQVDQQLLERAVCMARLDGLVAKLPQGLDTQVGERGLRLSGGERQRVGIARALYRQPKVLVLDEATNALDVTTEREINEEVMALVGGATVVIVTHRLSTVRSCDRLFFFQQGRMVAQGAYDELTATHPQFAAMDRESRHALHAAA